MEDVEAFYDHLAADYDAIFVDWDASVRRQGEIIDGLIRAAHGDRPASVEDRASVLDATCGIGTQAIGLALRGYTVTATDLSSVSVERAQHEAARLDASIAFGVADIRSLPASIGGPFDVALSFDNAVSHLRRPQDLSAALASLRRVLHRGGLLLVSIRDYDALIATRPSGELPRLSGAPGARRMVAQAWEWDQHEPIYRLHQFVAREGDDGRWSTRHLETSYRALRRDELAHAAARAGFGQIRWLEPEVTGYYQPILEARAA
jgi:glycine/sarcosine N-methyltransferase